MKDVVEAIIEIPNGSRNKFEIKDGKIKLDRVLYSSMSYPAEYGFIDNTLKYDIQHLVDNNNFDLQDNYRLDYFLSKRI